MTGEAHTARRIGCNCFTRAGLAQFPDRPSEGRTLSGRTKDERRHDLLPRCPLARLLRESYELIEAFAERRRQRESDCRLRAVQEPLVAGD